jgi:alginate O-acetyltransferase complex protein AlgI
VLFNSFPFLFVFLPIAIALYFGLARLGNPKLATLSLVGASLLFYGYWDWRYLGLLVASTLFNYGIGSVVRRHRHRGILVGGIAANLLLLGFYKYAAFGAQSVNALFHLHLPIPQVVLPLAISFYTFTQIAFIVDAYQGRAEEMNLPRYGLFVFFFPHLIAGPIVHHKEIMPQFAESNARKWNSANFAVGLAWLTLGLFKKVLIADTCAPWANHLFDYKGAVTIMEAWVGILAYTMQLYFDFSGYSDMAIGLSWMFNVRLPDNFNAPYRAESIIDFWRRWHMTLSRFLRDYLYIPLGGNRMGGARRYVNLLLTMVLGGLWHGAGWTFLAWGAFHGALLTVNHLWKEAGFAMPRILARGATFIAVMAGWCLFRAPDMDRARRLLAAMWDFGSFRLQSLRTFPSPPAVVFLLVLVALVNWAPTTKDWVESRTLDTRHAVLLALLFGVCLFVMRDVTLNLRQNEFIYFQF